MREQKFERSSWVACFFLVMWSGLIFIGPVQPAMGDSTVYEPRLLLMEDRWPQQSDMDFNDVAMRFHVAVYRDATEKLSRIVYSLAPQAYGSTRDNGLALRIPAPVQTPHIARLQRSGEAPKEIDPVMGESELTFVLYDHIRDAFPGSAASEFINTQPGEVVRSGEAIELEIQFDPSLDILLQPPFDFFIFLSGNYARQIHLPEFGPTGLGLADSVVADLFGSQDDCSDQICVTGDGSVTNNIGRYYVGPQGVPWVLEVPDTTAWAKEGAPLDQAYPDVSEWIASGGATHTDWWLNGDALHLFVVSSVPGLLPGGVWLLVSVVAGLGALRLRSRP